MQGNEAMWKGIITTIIWLISGSLSLAVILSTEGNFNGDSLGMMAIPLIVAVAGTFFVWVASELVKRDRIEAEAQRDIKREERLGNLEKEKHATSEGTRMALLLEMMDADERQVFKQSLKRKVLGESRLTTDGELSESTSEYLYDEDEQHRSYQ